jgi:hypothetical protein
MSAPRITIRTRDGKVAAIDSALEWHADDAVLLQLLRRDYTRRLAEEQNGPPGGQPHALYLARRAAYDMGGEVTFIPVALRPEELPPGAVV